MINELWTSSLQFIYLNFDENENQAVKMKRKSLIWLD